jgi:hypothetical protein
MPAYPAIALSNFAETASRIRRRSSANDQRFLTALAITLGLVAFGKRAREEGRAGRSGGNEESVAENHHSARNLCSLKFQF